MLWLIYLSCTSVEKTEELRSLKSIASLSFPAWFLSQSIVPELEQSCLLPAGEDALHWNPAPEVIASLGEHDVIVGMGKGYESWIQTASLPSKKLISLNDKLASIPLKGQTHSHGSGGTHQHHGMNPYVWLDPKQYDAQIFTLQTVILSFPEQDDAVIQERVSVVHEQLVTLSEQLMTYKEKLSSFVIAADSQRFAYLEKALELDIHAFDFPAEIEFRTKHLQDFMGWYQPETSVLMIWSYHPSAEIIQKFPNSVRHLYFDTLVQPAENGTYDYIQQFNQNLTRLSEL